MEKGDRETRDVGRDAIMSMTSHRIRFDTLGSFDINSARPYVVRACPKLRVIAIETLLVTVVGFQKAYDR